EVRSAAVKPRATGPARHESVRQPASLDDRGSRREGIDGRRATTSEQRDRATKRKGARECTAPLEPRVAAAFPRTRDDRIADWCIGPMRRIPGRAVFGTFCAGTAAAATNASTQD